MSISQTDRQTDTDIPTDYLSIRLTVEHLRWPDVMTILEDVEVYMAWPHKGKDGENEHFHILIPDTGRKFCDVMRNRIKRKFGDGRGGNGLFSIKNQSNGLLAGIQYCGHEDTTPYTKGPECSRWIEEAPKWVEPTPKLTQTRIGEKRKPVHEDHFREITYRNMLKVCLRFRADRKLETRSLGKVLELLHKENYFLNVQVLRQGIPSTFFDEFEARCSDETVMREGRFNRMRVVASWEGGQDRSF